MKSNVCYVTQGVLLLTGNQPFTKQEWITWKDSTYFQVQSIKKKGKHEKYSVGVHNKGIVHSVYEKNMETTIQVSWCQNTLSHVIPILVVLYMFLWF